MAKTGSVVHYLLVPLLLFVTGFDQSNIILKDISGTFQSPAISTKRPVYQQWSITAIVGKRIELSFGRPFDVGNEDDTKCDFSYIKVYDGDRSRDSLIDTFCTGTPPEVGRRFKSLKKLSIFLQLRDTRDKAEFTATYVQIDVNGTNVINPAGGQSDVSDGIEVYIAISVGGAILVIGIAVIVIIFWRKRSRRSSGGKRNKSGINLTSDHRYDYTTVSQRPQSVQNAIYNTAEIEDDDKSILRNSIGSTTEEITSKAHGSGISRSQPDYSQTSYVDRVVSTTSDGYSKIKDIRDSSNEPEIQVGTKEIRKTDGVTYADIIFDDGTYNVLATNKAKDKASEDFNDEYDHLGDEGAYNEFINKGRQPQLKNEDVAGVYDHPGALDDDYNRLNIGRTLCKPKVDDTYDHNIVL